MGGGKKEETTTPEEANCLQLEDPYDPCLSEEGARPHRGFRKFYDALVLAFPHHHFC